MGQPGDLLLVFADALTRSWKQITKFKPAGAAAPVPPAAEAARPVAAASARKPAERAAPASESLRMPVHPATDSAATSNSIEAVLGAGEGSQHLEGLIRDERGVRLAPEAED